MNFIHKSYSTLRNKISDALYGTKDFRSAKKHLLSDAATSDKDKALLKKVALQIHPNDGMYQDHVMGAARLYLSVGLSAIHCIEGALEKLPKNSTVRSVLDMPCGYGRVLRFLKVRFPHAEISASDIDLAMLDFCKLRFGARPMVSAIDFTKLSVSNKFDLIWCGSLITHIDEISAIQLLKFFHDHLAPGGLCVFTTHGQFSVESIQNQTITYGLTGSAQNEVLAQFHKKGYGYADYENQKGYGISVVSHERMLAMAHSVADWKEVSFIDRGWDNHQDVYGFIMPTSQS